MRKLKRTQAALNLPTLTLEGGLFLPDQLEKAALGSAQWQTEAEYGTPKGLKLQDDYSRAFQIACAQWKHFAAQLERADVDAAALTKTFVQELLRDVFGYSLQSISGITVGERRYPVGILASGVSVVVAPHTISLSDGDPRFAIAGAGVRKKSAFMLAQELLNASPEHLWGMACNGKQLRLLRDAATLTRPSYLEVDLADLLGGQRYAEFANVWRLLHASRAAGEPSNCIWERWRAAGQAEGTRVRDGLRVGVTDALLTLGEGFLQHPANEVLRVSLHNGQLSKDEYFQQLLRLIYRLIFVFSVEERGLLHPRDDSKAALAARRAYAEGYALARLRELSLKRCARNRFDDHWQALRIVIKGLSEGEPRLALPALGGLFAAGQCPALDAASLDNAHLLAAMQKLRWASHKGVLAPVDYRNMGPEELGSVYESLLELVPDVDLVARKFGFVGLTSEGSTAGNARKLSGSYYTPELLVQELIKSALDPVIAQRIEARPDAPVDALLAIRVVDPACGSGHFLLAAARRLAEKLAQLRAADGEQTEHGFRHALREVVAKCIFGVDRNPMAIELARTALWLEGFEEGRPLGFLDHHLQVGDALLGLTDLKSLERGIAKDAFKPLSGDDKDVCKQLAKTNAAALKDLGRKRNAKAFGQLDVTSAAGSGLAELQAIEALPEDTTKQIETKEAAYQAFLQQARTSRLAHAADLLVGAFLLPKLDASKDRIPTSATLYLTLLGEQLPLQQQNALAAAQAGCAQARVFHWPLGFPQVFASGGFDCVLGNPPWERIKLQEEEFFATRHRDVAEAKNKAERAQRIQWLSEGLLAPHLFPQLEHSPHEREVEKRLYEAFITARRTAEAASQFAHVKGEDGGRYPLTGVGDVNTYALFAETISQINHASGRAGFIVPTGIATDDSTKAYFGHLAQSKRLVELCSFENEEFIFPSVHHAFKFCIVTIGTADHASFAFFARQPLQIHDPRRRFTLKPEEFRLINPNTLTCPVFRSERDAELTKKLHRVAPVFIDESHEPRNLWQAKINRIFDMGKSADQILARDAAKSNEDIVRIYEAKYFYIYDHRLSSFDGGEDRPVSVSEKNDPYRSIASQEVMFQRELEARLLNNRIEKEWMIAFRDVTNATNERTIIAAIIPRVATNYTVRIVATPLPAVQCAALIALLNCLVLDYAARQKIGGTHLSDYITKQLPVLSPNSFSASDLAFIIPRVLELTYTAHDLKGWAEELGHSGPPFAYDPARRAQLRAELDAYCARLYGLTRDELRYMLDPAEVMGEDYPSETFRVLKNKELREFGEYRTQKLVLDAWDVLEVRQPSTIPTSKPMRRAVPLSVYAEGKTPATEAEDWLAGLVFDVLLQTGPCDDARLRLILGTPLPENTPHAAVLSHWLASVNPGRWGQIIDWLHALLEVPVTMPLSVRSSEALEHVLGDNRTASLARALIEARRYREAALEVALSVTGAGSEAQPDGGRKRG